MAYFITKGPLFAKVTSILVKKEGEWRRQAESNRWQHNRRLQSAYTVSRKLLRRFLVGRNTIYATGGEKQRWQRYICASDFGEIEFESNS